MKHLRFFCGIALLLSLSLLNLLHAQCTTTITTFPYFENFDGTDPTGGWVTTNVPSTSSTVTTSWKARDISLPVASLPATSVAMSVINSNYSGSTCWATGWTTVGVGPAGNPTYVANSQTGRYENGENSCVTSPCFNLTGMANPTFSAMVWWDIHDGDRVEVQYSINGGSFVRLGNHKSSACGWYNWNDSITSTANPKPAPTTWGFRGRQLNGTPPGSMGWVRIQHSLKQFAGQSNVRLRFYLRANASAQSNGFAFDDVQIKDLSSVDLMPGVNPNSKILCYGDTVVFNVTNIVQNNGYCYWTTKPSNAPFNGSTSPLIKAVDKAWYKVKATDSTGFCYVDSAYINANALVVYLGNDRILCPGDSLVLNGGSGTTYQWREDSLNTPILHNGPSITVNQTGTYLETIIYQGCTLTDDINIAIEQVPDVNLGVNTAAICAGQSYQLNAGNAPLGTKYDWFFNGVLAFNSQAIFVSSPGWYKALITTPSAACQDSDSMFLQVNLPPVTDLGQNRYVCSPETLQVASGPGITTQWIPTSYGTGGNAVFVPVQGQPGQTIIVTATDALGCTSSDTVLLTPGTDPDASLGSDQVLCAGSSLVLTTVSNNLPQSTYLWSNGQKTPSIIVTSPGKYSVTITNPGGCKDTDEMEVTIDPLIVDLGDDRVICENSTLQLQANTSTTNVNYLWNTPAQQTTPNITINGPGTYIVTATNASGCIDRDTVNVAGLPALPAWFTMPNDTVILYQSIPFTDSSAAGVTTWSWHFGNGPTDVSTQKNPSHAFVALGTFTVTLTVSDGLCTTTVTRQITVVLPVDTDAESLVNVSVAPNPNRGLFSVSLSLAQASGVSLSLLATDGRTAWETASEMAQDHAIQVDATSLNAGVYVLKVATEAGTVYRKVVIN